jgi:hypothetical protein
MDDAEDTIEKAYCKRLMDRIVEYELDPKNFTKLMRARTTGWRQQPFDGEPHAIGRRQQ